MKVSNILRHTLPILPYYALYFFSQDMLEEMFRCHKGRLEQYYSEVWANKYDRFPQFIPRPKLEV